MTVWDIGRMDDLVFAEAMHSVNGSAINTNTVTGAPMCACCCEGVTSERLEALGQLGFCRAAILGAVWQAADPLQALTVALARAKRVTQTSPLNTEA